MRSRISALVLCCVLVVGFTACNKQQSQNQPPATDNTATQPNQMAGNAPQASQSQTAPSSPQQQMAPTPEMAKEKPAPPPPPPPLEVPAGSSLVVRMGNTIDTKTANAGDTFTGTLAHAVAVNGEVAIPSGASVTGKVTDSKSPGRFKGEGTLAVTLTSVEVNGVPTDIETTSYVQTVKGKGKRTAVITGGGAGAGALIGGLAGGGKGALIGGLVGAGAGGAGSAFTGNKDLKIPAESAVTFKLSNSIMVKRTGKKQKASAADQASQ